MLYTTLLSLYQAAFAAIFCSTAARKKKVSHKSDANIRLNSKYDSKGRQTSARQVNSLWEHWSSQQKNQCTHVSGQTEQLRGNNWCWSCYQKKNVQIINCLCYILVVWKSTGSVCLACVCVWVGESWNKTHLQRMEVCAIKRRKMLLSLCSVCQYTHHSHWQTPSVVTAVSKLLLLVLANPHSHWLDTTTELMHYGL